MFIDTNLARRKRLVVGDHLLALGIRTQDRALFNVSLPPKEAAARVRRGELGTKLDLRVVGIGAEPDHIVVDEGFNNAYLLLTPAFRTQHPDVLSFYFGLLVRLHGGAASIPAFRRAVERLVPGEAIAFQTAPVTAAKFDRAVQPYVDALTVFAVVVGLTGLLLVGQALARQSFLAATDAPTLQALGLARRQLWVLAMLRAGLVAVFAAVLAVVLAIAASPLMPLGPARTAEPDPGLSVDGLVIGSGAVVVLIAVVALAAYPAWRYARGRAISDGERASSTSRVARWLAGAGAPITAVTGVRMALEPGRGRTAVPVRTTIVALGLAVTVVVGAIGVGASIDHLVGTPRLFGWNWDVQLNVSKGDPAANAKAHHDVERLLERSPVVRGWSTVVLSDVRLGAGAVPALGIDPRRPTVRPSLVSGRLPRRDGEIALGARTLRALDASVGSTVRAHANDGAVRPLRVVGRVVLPGVGTYPGSDKTALGEGAVVTAHALSRLGPDFHDHDYVIDFAPGASAAARKKVLDRAARLVDANGPNDSFAVGVLRRPSDIISYEHVSGTPLALAAVLALLALASVVHALVTAVRRRRRDLAMLETLGFTRRQVSATVAWQATTVATFALLMGIPLGVLLARQGWIVLADNLGTVAEPVVPAIAVAAVAVATLLLTNLAALVPARLAARLRPATVLRSE